MGIKTISGPFWPRIDLSLKNLPTTWGLRLIAPDKTAKLFLSEKPPHHMGIKTDLIVALYLFINVSEKPPHHMGIKTREFPTL